MIIFGRYKYLSSKQRRKKSMKILDKFLYKNKDNPAINFGDSIIAINTFIKEDNSLGVFINSCDMENNQLPLERVKYILDYLSGLIIINKEK